MTRLSAERLAAIRKPLAHYPPEDGTWWLLAKDLTALLDEVAALRAAREDLLWAAQYCDQYVEILDFRTEVQHGSAADIPLWRARAATFRALAGDV